MLVQFFFNLRAAGIPVSIGEFLSLLEALHKGVAFCSAGEFYFLGRLSLVKDERYFDRYDRVFAEHFAGAERLFEEILADVPEEWLRSTSARVFSEQEKEKIVALGGWDKLLQTLRERLKAQNERHQGGSKWIGTGGTSPFGAYGYNPEGLRMGQEGSKQRRAVKVWDAREYRNLDDSAELGTRNLKMALRKLRRFARVGAIDQLDLDGTINATARNAGWLDLKMIPERRNAVKVLLLFDSGGSMHDHIPICEQLFTAARTEFKHMEYFYFHNFIYESLWKDNRRSTERFATNQLLRTFNSDYRVVIVGDATMSPYEITQVGGSVQHWNEESGAQWIQRLIAHFPHIVWLNPEPAVRWDLTPSIRMVREHLSRRMFPLTIAGIDQATKELQRRGLVDTLGK